MDTTTLSGPIADEEGEDVSGVGALPQRTDLSISSDYLVFDGLRLVDLGPGFTPYMSPQIWTLDLAGASTTAVLSRSNPGLEQWQIDGVGVYTFGKVFGPYGEYYSPVSDTFRGFEFGDVRFWNNQIAEFDFFDGLLIVQSESKIFAESPLEEKVVAVWETRLSVRTNSLDNLFLRGEVMAYEPLQTTLLPAGTYDISFREIPGLNSPLETEMVLVPGEFFYKIYYYRRGNQPAYDWVLAELGNAPVTIGDHIVADNGIYFSPPNSGPQPGNVGFTDGTVEGTRVFNGVLAPGSGGIARADLWSSGDAIYVSYVTTSDSTGVALLAPNAADIQILASDPNPADYSLGTILGLSDQGLLVSRQQRSPHGYDLFLVRDGEFVPVSEHGALGSAYPTGGRVHNLLHDGYLYYTSFLSETDRQRVLARTDGTSEGTEILGAQSGRMLTGVTAILGADASTLFCQVMTPDEEHILVWYDVANGTTGELPHDRDLPTPNTSSTVQRVIQSGQFLFVQRSEGVVPADATVPAFDVDSAIVRIDMAARTAETIRLPDGSTPYLAGSLTRHTNGVLFVAASQVFDNAGPIYKMGGYDESPRYFLPPGAFCPPDTPFERVATLGDEVFAEGPAWGGRQRMLIRTDGTPQGTLRVKTWGGSLVSRSTRSHSDTNSNYVSDAGELFAGSKGVLWDLRNLQTIRSIETVGGVIVSTFPNRGRWVLEEYGGEYPSGYTLFLDPGSYTFTPKDFGYSEATTPQAVTLDIQEKTFQHIMFIYRGEEAEAELDYSLDALMYGIVLPVGDLNLDGVFDASDVLTYKYHETGTVVRQTESFE